MKQDNESNAAFIEAQSAAAETLIEASLLLTGGNAAKAALALRAAAEIMHCEAIAKLHEVTQGRSVQVYDNYHSALEASGKAATKRLLAAQGIDYEPAVAIVVPPVPGVTAEPDRKAN